MRNQQESTGVPLSLFISYAHEDEPMRQQLEAHLSLLRRQGLIAHWHDRQILAGDEWAYDIDQHLQSASIILLLISPDFLASDYCYEIEMERALERHQRGEARVIPIILRPCDWQSSPFARLQSLPRGGKAITAWQNQDEAFLIIAEGLRRAIRQQIPSRPLPEVERKNRRSLINRVRATWIEGLLEHSLHEATRLELHLQERPDVLANPWRLQVQELDRLPQLLPPGTSIVQVYDKADGELLILGEPGAGKTTLLLELVRTLLDRAQVDEHHPLPVVFHLSSWAEKCSQLSDWLVEELWTKYQVPRKIGQSWVTSGQLLPLLDGLDEMAEDARPGCVQAINTYYQQRMEHGSAQLVVCCRSQEYMVLPTRVTLHQAVSIQLLNEEQIESYLQSAGGQLEALRQALQGDAELYALACRPLMLSIFTLTYQEANPKDLPTRGTREATSQRVFAAYVERMLKHRTVSKQISQEQTRRWLIYLAQQMRAHQQTIFSLEQLQPDWLPQKQQRLYQWSIGLVFGLIGALVLGLIGELAFGLIGALFGALGFGLLGGLSVGRGRRIRPAEAFTWSWKKVRLSFGLFFGLFFGLVLFWGLGFVNGGGLFFGLFFGLVLFWGLGFGLSGKLQPEGTRLSPNEGIWRSVKNGLGVGLFGGLGVGLFGGLGVGLGVGLGIGLTFGLLSGLGSGLGIGLTFGLGAALQHYILRFWLWHAGYLPWNLVVFLDEADERLLLRKVGGGYIFVHRLLLDYFASSGKKEVFDQNPELQKKRETSTVKRKERLLNHRRRMLSRKYKYRSKWR